MGVAHFGVVRDLLWGWERLNFVVPAATLGLGRTQFWGTSGWTGPIFGLCMTYLGLDLLVVGQNLGDVLLQNMITLTNRDAKCVAG